MLRSETLLAWLLTYALHSTLLLGIAWVLTRRLVQPHGVRDLIWKTALIGGLVSSSVQVIAGIEPVGGSYALEAAAATSQSTELRPADPPTRPSALRPADPPTRLSALRPADPPTRRSGLVLALAGWIITALILAAHLLTAQFLLVVRVGRRALVRDAQLVELVDLLREEAGLRHHIRLTRAEGLPSPVALGLSEICIPDAALTELDREQQESMLAHELAHLARRDPVWLFVSCLIERIFFFQPLNRLARRRIQESAEYLCDDWAARRSGSGLTLAKCLVKVAEWIDTMPEPVPVSGMAEMRSHFVSRIHRLIANHALVTQPTRRWLVPAAMGAVAVIVAAAPGVTATRTVGRSDGRTGSATSQSISPAAIATRTVESSETRPATTTNVEFTVRPSDRPTVQPSDRLTVDAPPMTLAQIRQGRDTAAITALMAALKDEDVEVRRAAARALGNRRDPRAVPALMAALGDSDAEVRAKVVEALAGLRDARATDGLVRALKDENAEVRAHAAEALGELPDTRRGYSAEAQRVIAALASLMSDVSAEVRKEAIQALREVKGARLTDPLITALKDADADVRQSAAEALGAAEARGAVQPLIAALSDPAADVRHAAAHALGHLRDPQATEPLTRLLKDPNAEVRQAAAESLGELELPQAPAALLEAMHDQSAEVRHQAVQAVGNIRDPRAVPALAGLLNDPDPDVREMAIEALSNIRDAAAIDALVSALQSKDPNVRKRAAEALGERN
ncbi:MAG: HEAT repeat domain-containing protein [Gemmatimonadetes bacterium]|nr:HEAT repeat domain-containing protein [Gemmatimonadota bacterium]